ncbi:MAG TPA: WhiB family transcriptional regulator, partial [Acidimicrobiales bacterium]|nr:WhiB family transcriptional regulator [Acidimicrobiales bacterium]
LYSRSQAKGTRVPLRNSNWQAEAACRDIDTNLFFPESEAAVAPALAVCAGCPVRDECLDFALRTRQDDGIWGGMTEADRRRLRRRIRRSVAA